MNEEGCCQIQPKGLQGQSWEPSQRGHSRVSELKIKQAGPDVTAYEINVLSVRRKGVLGNQEMQTLGRT